MGILYLFLCVGALRVSHGQRPGAGGGGGECASDAECGAARACVGSRCADPCWGACGLRAACTPRDHNAHCACPPPLAGDPYTACGDAEASPAPAARDPCAASPCGPHAECTPADGAARCACAAGYAGAPPQCRAECAADADCGDARACVDERCVDPCRGVCAPDADCHALRHAALCVCRPGYAGDPYLECVPNAASLDILYGTTDQTMRFDETSELNKHRPDNEDDEGGWRGSTDPLDHPTTLPPDLTRRPVAALEDPSLATARDDVSPPPPRPACAAPLGPPPHGAYSWEPSAAPGERVPWLYLNVSCAPGYGVAGNAFALCTEGNWSGPPPVCVRMCALPADPSVEYRCLVEGEGLRACRAFEPAGTVVNPRCRRPNYYAAEELYFMRCNAGRWNYVAKCAPECGKVTPSGVELVVGGAVARRGELPWHAGVYSKSYRPYLQVCGGTLVSRRLVISAAHCFWRRDAPLPASQFALAVGKLYRPWDNRRDDAQKTDVAELRLPPRFQGSGANFQDDIAVLVAAEPFEFRTFVRPVCLSFDLDIERMPHSAPGKVAGWGLTAENGNASAVLRVIDLPYVEVAACLRDLPYSFREFITSDKICAGTRGGGAGLCRGDSGGGLAFPVADRGAPRYFLHGVVSAAPNAEDAACSVQHYTAFTQVIKHELFIKQFWSERDDAEGAGADRVSVSPPESAAMPPPSVASDDYTPYMLPPPGTPFVRSGGSSGRSSRADDDIRPKIKIGASVPPAAPATPELDVDVIAAPIPWDACAPSPCGAHAECRAVGALGGRAACACAPGRVGAPPACRPCARHADCARAAVCERGTCVPACEGACGVDATCTVLVDHVLACNCAPGYTGDPFTRCVPEEDEVAAPRDACSPSPCGPHAACRVVGGAVGGHAACACRAGYFGLPPRCRPCAMHAECGRGRACVRGACVDPCRSACGANATCTVLDHVPACACAPGDTGDPFTRCAPEEELGVSYPAVSTESSSGRARRDRARTPADSPAPASTPAGADASSRGYAFPSQTINTTIECGRLVKGSAPPLWQCAVYWRPAPPPAAPRNRPHCAGTLLTPRHVLSAALCFWEERRGGGAVAPVWHFAVRAGNPRQMLPVAHIWVPESFRGAAGAGGRRDEVALVTLARAAGGGGAPLCRCGGAGDRARRSVGRSPRGAAAGGAAAGGAGVAALDGPRPCLLGVVSAAPPPAGYMPLQEHLASIWKILARH